MQKKLIALAIAGLSSAAFAQSNVTIYGTMDATFESTGATGATLTAAGLQARDMATRSRITSNSSYIGFKGAESLGNGLTAVFQIENQISADGNAGGAVPNTFTSTTQAWNSRDTYMGIAGGFGTAAIGYLSTPTRSLAAGFDVMPGATGAATSTLSIIGRINTGVLLNPLAAAGTTSNNIGGTTALSNETVANSVGYLTRENAIAYITPNFSGFSAVVAYVPNEGKFGTPNVTNGSTRNPSAVNVALNYDNAGLKVGYAYLELTDTGVVTGVTAGSNAGAAAVTTEKHKDHMFGIGYTFGGTTTVNFLYDSFRGNLGMNAAAVTAGYASTVTAKRNAWMLGVKHVMGQHELAAQYSKANDTEIGGGVAGTDYSKGGANMFAVRYGYNFSKRTQVYALYSRIDNKANGNYDFGTGGAVSNATAVDGTNRINAGADPRTIGVGMRHSF